MLRDRATSPKPSGRKSLQGSGLDTVAEWQVKGNRSVVTIGSHCHSERGSTLLVAITDNGQ